MSKRLRGYRRGDLAEGMGLEIARRFALVVPVPRTEDVGVDGICTLLRRDVGVLHAENTFAIQIKSSSIRELELDQARLDWLARFELPLFWVSIDLKAGRGSVHSLVNLILPWPTTDGVTVLLDEPVGGPRYGSQPWVASEQPARMWAGPPVLTFDFAEVDDPGFEERSYSALKPHLELMSRSLMARRVGVYSGVTWSQDQPPTVTSAVLHGGENLELRDVLDAMVPPSGDTQNRPVVDT